MGKPVKLMWHRTDEFRQGRTHPMSTSRVRANYALARCSPSSSGTPRWPPIRPRPRRDDHRDWRRTAGRQHRILRDHLRAESADPYNFGVTTQLLNEVRLASTPAACATSTRPTCVRAGTRRRPAGRRDGQGPVLVPPEYLKDARLVAVLDKAASAAAGDEPGGRHGPGDRGALRVPGRDLMPGRDRLHPRDGRTGRSRTASPGRASPRRCRRRRRLRRSTRAGWRRR